MKVKIASIEHNIVGLGECIVLEVLQDTDIGKYLLLDFASSKIIHTFWLPDLPVKQGDVIHLYTNESLVQKDVLEVATGVVHKLYWKLPEWKGQNETNCLALIEANDWCFQDVKSKAA